MSPSIRALRRPLTVGIRREDPARIWERRCPLTPDAIHNLKHNLGVDVLVQPCERRVFRNEELVKAGATIHPTLSPAHIILGIKETPLQEVLTDHLSDLPRTHLMFSHTHKGQAYNMPLLAKFLGEGQRPRLIDYELLTDEAGKRTVGFGWFAGVSGALESLSALAHALLERGVASAFLSTPRPHTHPSLPSLLHSLRTLVSDRIVAEGTPKALGPVVIGVTGTGKVTQGVLDLLEHLPIQRVSVEDLPALVSNPDTDLHKIYLVHALPPSYLCRTDSPSAPYDREHYYANPGCYESEFHVKVAPYLTLLLNGVGWSPGFPRLMSNAQLIETLMMTQGMEGGKGLGRFACVGDISCDVEGGLEFLSHATTLSTPSFNLHPSSLPAHTLPSSSNTRGLRPVTIMAVDILPTALPKESSEHFSGVLVPYLDALVRNYERFALSGDKRRDGEKEGLEGDKERLDALERATVASGGELRERHLWLEEPLKVWRESLAGGDGGVARAGVGERKKKVLVLGSGMVAGPAVEELVRDGQVEVVVASDKLNEAQKLTQGLPNASARHLDIQDLDAASKLIEQADVVVSLLPVPLHPAVAELCVKKGKHMVTASYISEGMKALHDRAEAAGVLLLNEIGLDPGIDHCSAISLLESIRSSPQKRVVSFTSFCGGLPAPECAEDVPLKYKFSWSPRGVLGASLNGARFLLGGEVCEIEGKRILKDTFPNLPISDVLRLEGIANRDSLGYAGTYELEKADLRTLVRGTIRYKGFSELMHAFKSIGLLSIKPISPLTSWTDFARATLSSALGSPIQSNDPKSLRSALELLVPLSEVDTVWDALTWLGVVPTRGGQARDPMPFEPPKAPMQPIDLFAHVLAYKLRYHPGERDLVILHHEILALSSPTPKPHLVEEEAHTSTLVMYGTPKHSAMALTVGLPVALAARAVLDGGVSARGVHGPGVERGVWGYVLDELARAGVGMKERVKRRVVDVGVGVGSGLEGALWEARRGVGRV